MVRAEAHVDHDSEQTHGAARYGAVLMLRLVKDEPEGRGQLNPRQTYVEKPSDEGNVDAMGVERPCGGILYSEFWIGPPMLNCHFLPLPLGLRR